MTQDKHQQRWLAVISKLNRMTRDGQLKWSKTQYIGGLPGLDSVMSDERFTCEHKGKEFVIWGPRLSGLLSIGDAKLGIRETGSSILLDQVSMIAGLDDLLQTVRARTTGVDEYLDRFLADK